MPSALERLPKNALDKVRSFLHEKSFLRLREVSKCAKEMVDGSILNAPNVKFWRFNVSKHNKGKTKFSFHIEQNHLTWRICLWNFLNNLKVAHKINKEDVILNMNKARQLLEYLKPSILESKIDFLEIFDDRSQIVQMCANVFAGSIIKNVKVTIVAGKKSDRADFKPWLELIQNLTVRNLNCTVPCTTKVSWNFIQILANEVDRIVVRMNKHIRSETDLVPNIRELLSCKCQEIFLQGTTWCISLDEAESLIQYLHHIEKRIFLMANTQEDPIEVQSGELEVEIIDYQHVKRITFEKDICL